MYHSGHATLFGSSVAEEYSPDETLRNNADTTEYMAPEQTHRREVGYYTDVFGVGVLFYRLLSGGELPYQVIEVDDEDEEGDGKTKLELDYYIAPVHPSVHNPRDFSDALLLADADLLH